MKAQDYSIVEQLRKTPAQILLLSLLIHSNDNCQALMKILNEAHVPDKISVNHLEMIVHKIFEVNRVTFSDDELPTEGTEHNKALYLTMKCEDSVVTRVLIDNGSSANICTLTNLNKLKVDHDRIHRNNVCVRGFDGGGTDTVGDIILGLIIGPVEFTMEFQVVDVEVSYNLLLGRPWIHAAKAVPSTLHQMPISFPENSDTFGLGFKPTATDLRRARKLKKKVWVLPKVVPRLSRSFIRAGIRRLSVPKILGPLIGSDGDLNPGFERLLADVNVIEAGEGSSRADIQYASVPNPRRQNPHQAGHGGRNFNGWDQWADIYHCPYDHCRYVPGLGALSEGVQILLGLHFDAASLAIRTSPKRVGPGNRVIEEVAEAQAKYNKLRKRVHEYEAEHREQHKADMEIINEWKESITFPGKPMAVICNETTQHKDSDSEEEDEIPEEIVREVENFENKAKSNLDETKAINLGDVETVKKTRISIHLSPLEKEEYIRFLKECEDIFAWSYDHMTSLSTSIVDHKMPTNPMCSPVKQKLRKFKPNMSLKN
ncbi:uncharacterized protein [Nicotiana sylvestris]|uniref:uncharacterized protein n=1 Tax=Nicotiana sylvestris TaxID=4096 RepID=UPI00388C63BC